MANTKEWPFSLAVTMPESCYEDIFDGNSEKDHQQETASVVSLDTKIDLDQMLVESRPFSTSDNSQTEFVNHQFNAPDITQPPVLSRRRMWPLGLRRYKAPENKRIEDVLNRLHNISDGSSRVTGKKDIPSGTKKTRKIYYKLPEDRRVHSKLMFEITPNLRAEFARMKIVKELGVKTADPLEFPINMEANYPYDFVVINEIAQTGASYYDLLDTVIEDPELTHKYAMWACQMLSGVHSKLTAGRDRFIDAKLGIPRENIRHELETRLYPGLRINPDSKDAIALTKAMEDMFEDMNPNLRVISHGDCHGNNVRALSGLFEEGQDDFSLIDWGTMMVASFYRDLMDFYVHHLRYVFSKNVGYQYKPGPLEKVYLKNSALRNKWFPKQGFPKLKFGSYDRKVEFVAVNLNEIADPRRTPNTVETIWKARYHMFYTLKFFNIMQDQGIAPAIRAENALRSMTRNVPYFHDIFKYNF